uniref:GDP/GTP exchange factor Sec2 N-terminal domain-containing protein n=1 Tax=Romanomermis culicivorax TaxID=13658 RepID=A0A915K8D2_ROMCU
MSDFVDNNFLPITVVPSSPNNNPSFFTSKIVCCAGGSNPGKMEDSDSEKVENEGNFSNKKDGEEFYMEDFHQHHRTSSHDENKARKLCPSSLAPLSAKNDSFLSIGTGSDLCSRSCSQEENLSATGESSAADQCRRESPVFTDEAESGRFTEQESMDLTNEFAAHDGDDEQEPDSENEIIEHLRVELDKARKELRAKNEKCEKLSEMQNIVDSEIHELTASLFQEAYKMVADANQKRHQAEKLYKEAAGKVEVLEAEVEALKTLVLTSTPSAPNRHLHPQLLPANSKKPPLAFFTSKKDSISCRSSSPFLGHKRNHSDTVSSCSNLNSTGIVNGDIVSNTSTSENEFREIDPNYYRDFTLWRGKMDPTDKSQSFLKRIYQEEISPCMNFPNEE